MRFCAVVLMLVVCAQAAPAVREKRDLMTGEQLTALYNTGVETAALVKRPKQGWPDDSTEYYATHSGVRVTLTDGRRFLIHKGLDYGDCLNRFDIFNFQTYKYLLICSDTVVTEETNMSSRWREPKEPDETQHFEGRKTVGDLIKAGGKRYNLLGVFRGNCHAAAKRMMKND